MVRAFLVKLIALALVSLEVHFVPAPFGLLAAGVTVLATIGFLAWVIVSPRAQFMVRSFDHLPDPRKKEVAFTFDDGPDPITTPLILDLLEKYDARATFFVVGRRAEQHPDLVRRIVSAGHAIGSHSYDHAHTFHLRSPSATRKEVRRGIDAVAAITGTSPVLFRPPQGLRTPLLRSALRPLIDLKCVTWTERGLDAMGRSSEAIVKRLAPALAPGAILTMHDGAGLGGTLDRSPTVAALERLLGMARERELACVSLHELEQFTPPVAHYEFRRWLPFPLWALYMTVRTVLIVAAFAGFWLGGTLLAWTVLPLVALLSKDHRPCQRILASSFRVFHGYMDLVGLLEVHARGNVPAATRSAAVIVANHTTLIDVTALLSKIPNVCPMARAKFSSSPWVGKLLAACGFIDAGDSLDQRAAAVDAAVRKLEQGYSVLIFPEGTRSPKNGMHRFQRGAFEIACRANVPVVPLVLRCTPSALRRGQRFWAQPDSCARLTIEMDEPMQPAEFEGKSRRMRQVAEERYRMRLGLGPVEKEA